MSFPLTIAGTVINFPSTADSPDWSQAVIAFAEAVTAALNGIVGPFDVSSQTLIIDASNPATNVNIPALSFPTSEVRAVFIDYAVYRTTSTSNAAEAGMLMAYYNPNNSPGSQWEMARNSVGNGMITFNMLDTGQLQYTTTALSGLNHTGTISFSAHALQQS